MHPRSVIEPLDSDDAADPGDPWTFEPDPADPADPTDGAARPSLDGLSVAGLTRRRAAFALGALVAIWIITVFARQVGDASAATARAEQLRIENGQIEATVAALEAELRLIGRQEYIVQQARGYGLGSPRERQFELAPGAPPLPSDAAGSAAVRLGAESGTRSPLDTWLAVLFGPDPGRRD